MSAKINIKNEGTHAFKDVDWNEIFYFQGTLYFRPDDYFYYEDEHQNAINLSDGTFCYFCEDTIVKKVEVEINATIV